MSVGERERLVIAHDEENEVPEEESIGTNDAWMSFLPGVAALLVVLTGWLASRYLIVCGEGAAKCHQHIPRFAPDTTNRSFAELDAHLGWVAAVSVFVIVAVATIAIAAWTHVASPRHPDRRTIFAVIEIVALLAVVPLVHAMVPAFDDFLLDDKLLDPTVYTVFPFAEKAVEIVELMAAAAIVVLIFVVCWSLISQPKPFHGPLSAAEKDTFLKKRTAVFVREIRTLRMLLVAGALLTILGVIQVTTLYGWATTMVGDEASRAAAPASPNTGGRSAGSSSRPYLSKADSVSAPVSMLAGTFYTLLLCAIFLPAFAVTQRRANQLWEQTAPANATETDRAKWFEDHQLSMSPPKQIASALALLSPTLVAGPLAALLKALTG
jgi:hypothetical protein